jgi:AcrR family transcriptional regulator
MSQLLETAARVPRKLKKKNTREALKAAALQCFARSGYAETQIAEVTETAGVAKGTFYVHFSDKDALLDELLAEFNNGFVERLRAVWTEERLRDPGRLARGVAEVFLTYWEENRAFIRAYAEKAAGGVELHELQFGVNPPMRDLLMAALRREGEQSGARLRNPELIVQGILAMWLRLGMQFLFNPNVSRPEVVDVLVDMTVGALGSVAAGNRTGNIGTRRIK